MAVGAKGKDYREFVRLRLRHLQNRYSKEDRLSLHISVYPPDKRKRDIDNITKCLLDSLEEAKVFSDDSQIDHLTIVRCPTEKNGRVKIVIDICS